MVNRDPFRLSFGRRLLIAAAGVTAVHVPVAVGALGTCSIRAQPAAGTLEFDAVSVKPSDPNSRNGTIVSFTLGAGLHVVDATLKDLIETGYDARELQILGGPAWLGITKYDVTAQPDDIVETWGSRQPTLR